MYTVIRDFPRPPSHVVEALGRFPTAVITDCMGRYGAMRSDIKGIYQGIRVAGPAFTVQTFRADNLMCHLAIKLAKPGDVLVIDASGFEDTALWGELMTTMARARGIAGVVIDGAIRDREVITQMRFPVFAKATTPMGGFKVLPGSINIPISCGGVTVNPGDVVVGDGDGVAVIPREQAAKVLEGCRVTAKKESELRSRFEAGETLYDILDLGRALEDKGVRWLDWPPPPEV